MNWDEIKLEYVTSDVSYRDLADKFGVSFSSLSKMAVKDKWAKERKKHRKKVVTKAEQKIVVKKAKELAKEIEIAEAISDILQIAVSHPEQFLALCDDGKERYNFGRINDALDALSKLERSKRSLYGILSEKEKNGIDLARERLDIAKSRAFVGGGDTSETGVVLLPVVDEEPSAVSGSGDSEGGVG